jgi:ABC-type glycerol-3-phosphate transport system permease component
MMTAASRNATRHIALYAIAGVGLAVWAFPVIWGLLTSFKTERDVLAYPPKFIFEPTLANYREVIFGASSIVPNLWSSIVVATGATLLTMLFAVPAAYALARLRYPGKRASGFYVLATQMLPPVGLIIPYYLVLQKIGGLDSYSGLTIIYLTFSLPFAVWLMVSYFEDVPLEMEEAALLDRAGRLRTLWYVILPQVRGGIAVTTIFVFLNAWNEFLFAVVLGGNRVRPVTVAMFNSSRSSRPMGAARRRAGRAALIDRALACSHRGLMSARSRAGGRLAFCARHRQAARRGRCARHGPDCRRVLRLLGPSGWEDDAAPPTLERWPPAACYGRRRRHRQEPGAPTSRWSSELRALSAHDGGAEHRLPAEDGRHAGERGRARGRCRRCQGRHRPLAGAHAGAAVGRAAAARGPRPGDRPPAEAVPARRAALQPRRQAAPRDPARPAQAAALARRDHRLRHPRPGRGDDARRPDRRVHGRADRPGRHAARDLRHAGDPRGRRLHRHAADEPAGPPGPVRASSSAAPPCR